MFGISLTIMARQKCKLLWTAKLKSSEKFTFIAIFYRVGTFGLALYVSYVAQ